MPVTRVDPRWGLTGVWLLTLLIKDIFACYEDAVFSFLISNVFCCCVFVVFQRPNPYPLRQLVLNMKFF